jgi:hypothetical protein
MGGPFVRRCFMPEEGIPLAPSERTAGTAPEPLWTLWKSEKTRKAERRIAASRLSSPRPSHCTGLQNKIVSQILVDLHTGHFHLTAVGYFHSS